MSQKVIIVGAGIGGLAIANLLLSSGYDVTIIEKYSKAGGRLNIIQKDGFIFDTGPTFVSMSYIIKEFAEKAKIKVPDLHPLDPLYSVFINNRKFNIYRDIDKLEYEFKDIEPNFKNKFKVYLEDSKKVFDDTFKIIVKRNFYSFFEYILSLLRLNPIYLKLVLTSFWEEIKEYFSSEELKKIVSLVSFFLGQSPFHTIAIYKLLSNIEFLNDGYYYIKGGMYELVKSLTKTLQDKIIYNTEIVDFISENNKIVALVDNNRRIHKADIFVINSDVLYFKQKVFKRYSIEKLNKFKWTYGFFNIYIGLNKKISNLEHHNYYINSNYNKSTFDLIKTKVNLEKFPYYYVNFNSKLSIEYQDKDSIIIIAPVPNLIYKKDWKDKEIIAKKIINDLSTKINLDLSENIITKIIYTPEDWAENFNLYQGSGLGLAHSLDQIGYFRPKNKDDFFKNVYYVGASTHPGTGIPMVITGAMLLFHRILKESNNNY